MNNIKYEICWIEYAKQQAFTKDAESTVQIYVALRNLFRNQPEVRSSIKIYKYIQEMTEMISFIELLERL